MFLDKTPQHYRSRKVKKYLGHKDNLIPVYLSTASPELMVLEECWNIIPTTRHHAASAVVDENIYVIGGRLTNSLLNTDVVEKYDPSSDSWTTALEPMPSKRSRIGDVSVNGFIYVLGGEENQGTFDSNERYDPVNNTWTIESPLPTARHGLGVTYFDNKIFVIGPRSGLTVSDENEIYIVNKTVAAED